MSLLISSSEGLEAGGGHPSGVDDWRGYTDPAEDQVRIVTIQTPGELVVATVHRNIEPVTASGHLAMRGSLGFVNHTRGT